MLLTDVLNNASANTRIYGGVAVIFEGKEGYGWQYVGHPADARKICTYQDGYLLQMARTATEEEAAAIRHNSYERDIIDTVNAMDTDSMIAWLYEFGIEADGSNCQDLLIEYMKANEREAEQVMDE